MLKLTSILFTLLLSTVAIAEPAPEIKEEKAPKAEASAEGKAPEQPAGPALKCGVKDFGVISVNECGPNQYKFAQYSCQDGTSAVLGIDNDSICKTYDQWEADAKVECKEKCELP